VKFLYHTNPCMHYKIIPYCSNSLPLPCGIPLHTPACLQAVNSLWSPFTILLPGIPPATLSCWGKTRSTDTMTRTPLGL
jgi:hypothetical protein